MRCRELRYRGTFCEKTIINSNLLFYNGIVNEIKNVFDINSKIIDNGKLM
jgi:hypothetical protein